MAISLILASTSPSRRQVLATAGVIPVVHGSDVDEPQALADAAAKAGKSVDEFSVEQRVRVLAQAKAQAVYDAWKGVRDVAESASGDYDVAYPLRAEQLREETLKHSDEDCEVSHNIADSQTRDFSSVAVPVTTFPMTVAIQANGHSDRGPIIVGCDSLFSLGGECYGKPHTPEIAIERIRRMRGNTGQLWTGHCVIDTQTGQLRVATSCADVTFGTMSEEEIHAYVATREPLEVAGSFTLEGFGAAFIERVEGDPHGVLGISLPLLRSMVAELGYQWHEFWNVPMLNQQEPSSPTSTVVPKENVHQPGDGWVECHCGRKHWGHNGAAGVLLARRNTQGKITHVVLQHRALWSAEGGTWGIPGGAITDGENAIEGALRESFEEAMLTPEDMQVVGAYREDHGNWGYTTVFAFEKPGHTVHPRAHDDESMEITWVPVEEVERLKLLTAFRTDWPAFCAKLDALAAGL